MFSFGKLKQQVLKVTASSNFLNALEKQSKNPEIVNNKERNQNKYIETFNSALSYLKKFTSLGGKDKESFKIAAQKFSDATKLKPTKPDSYFYLSWLFLFASDIELASKYYNVVNVIDPNFEGIKDLQESINSIKNNKSKITPKRLVLKSETLNKPQSVNKEQIKKLPDNKEETFKPRVIKSTANEYSKYKY